ncbi:hypothetical protein HPB48_025550 [Haemaphysalis longicornis]|uniref:Potassium channel domain-containing protein n=1 Tax=Haemaphysalis longicornis TaxID=44386 RepID=A0A9J6H932_HAELO|nr:hypothetical protein HPB48_025550 [Haemaphysalis longicornis]
MFPSIVMSYALRVTCAIEPRGCSVYGKRCGIHTTSACTQERIPVYLVLVLVGGYICFGATLFSVWEQWSFLDGAYFSFITLSTIGFGDFVPGSDLLEQGATSGSGQAKLIICCFYLVLGLAIIAMAFSLVQEEVVLKCKDLANALKALVSTDDTASSTSGAAS